MSYRMIGIDLDGTLLDRLGQVSPANILAVQNAKKQGVLVVPCTGRCWQESRKALSLLDGGTSQGVFVTGAAVCDLSTGHTLNSSCIDPTLVYQLVNDLQHAPDALLLFRDRQQVGYDYLVTGQGHLTDNTQWWIKTNSLSTHFQKTITPADCTHVWRVGMVTPQSFARPAVQRIQQQWGTQVLVHSFEALHMPDQPQPLDVLEIFAAGVDKWRGLAWVAHHHQIPLHQIAVIGDQINDIQMMQHAGCSVAMGNAPPTVQKYAKYITRPCEEDGAAHAISQILSGRWS